MTLARAIASRGSAARADRAAGALEALAAGPRGAEKAISVAEYGRRWMSATEGGLGGGLNAPLAPYQQTIWTYRCVSKIFQAAAGVPLRLMRQGPEASVRAKSFMLEIRRSRHRTLRPVAGRKAVCVGRAAEGDEITSGPAADLLVRPNGYQDWGQFFTATVGYLLLRGKVAWILADLVGRRPEAMHVVDGRHVRPAWLLDARGIHDLLGYEYTHPKTGAKIRLAPDEVKYFSLWDDSPDPLGGMSPTVPGRLAITTDYNASLFNASALVNGADPGLVIRARGNVTSEQRADFEEAFLQRNAGPARAKNPLLLAGVDGIEALQSTFADLQFDQGKRTTRLEICCLWGVPPVVAGWVDAAGDSSAYTENSLRQFWQESVFPLLDGFAPAIQEIVSRLDAAALAWFDVEDQPIVQAMRLSRVETAGKLFGMGYAPNAINGALDLGMPETPEGEVGFVSAGLIPVRTAIEGAAVSPDDEGPSSGESDDLGQAAAAVAAEKAAGLERAARSVWEAFARAFEGLARRGVPILRARYRVQERRVQAALRRGLEAAGYAPGKAAFKADYEPVLGRILAEVFEDETSRKTFRARLASFLGDGRTLGLRQALAEAGLAGAALEAALRRLASMPGIREQLARRAVLVSTKADRPTRIRLKRTLATGLSRGEDMRRLAGRVQKIMRGQRAGAMVVARNAVGQVLSAARADGQKAAGMTHKFWMHSRGPGERRPAHEAAEGRYASAPIPLDALYEIGSARLRFPRDFESGPPAETVNCQCVSIARRMTSEEAALAPDQQLARVLADYAGRAFLGAGDLPPRRAKGVFDAGADD